MQLEVELAARKKTKIDAPTEEEQHGFVEGAKEIEEVRIPEFMDQTRLPYAWSVIRERALVDSRDGLKPVQRRILWTLYEDKVLPSREFMKVARLAGNVLRYHPHGNTSVEDALVRMAQPYSLRVPLIWGKGSFGAHPGDEAAASRYIEAKLNKEAVELLDEISSGSVKMIPNFDDTLKEPEVLPVRWPVGVINGSQGIAVGYAANMPQHNPTETLKACKLLLRKPNASLEEVMQVMPGPDFWTGGQVIGIDGVQEYFRTGKGTFTVRAKYKQEQQTRGKVRFTFYELPPNVSCESIVQKVRNLIKTDAKFKEGIARVDDLTGRVNDNDVRLLIETKAGSNSQEILAMLFKKTELQSTFSVNNTVVSGGFPKMMGIRELLLEFLELRKQCVLTRSQNYKEKKLARIHQIDGLLAILLDVDKAIAIIRKSDSQEDARVKLMKAFKIDEGQANYVLDMQLRKLTRQDSDALKAEDQQLKEDIDALDKILTDDKELRKVINAELDKEIKIIGRPRLMEITGLTDEEAKNNEKQMLADIRREGNDTQTFMYVTTDGRLFKTPDRMTTISDWRSDPSMKPVEPFVSSFKTTTQARLGIVGTDGREYAVSASFLRNGEDTTMSKMASLPKGVKPVTILPDDDRQVLVASADGMIRKMNLNTNGKWDGNRPFVKLADGDRLVSVIDLSNVIKNSTVLIITQLGKVIRFNLDDVSPVSLGSQLIKGMNLKKDDKVAAVVVARPDAESLVTMSRSTIKVTPLSDITVSNRGGAGVMLHPLDKLNGVVSDRIETAAVDGVLMSAKNKVVGLPDATPRAAKPTVNMNIGAKLASL